LREVPRRCHDPRQPEDSLQEEDDVRIAVVHDWLYVIGGAERVLSEILRCYPQADVFTLFDVLTPADREKLGFERAHTSFLQKMPLIRSHHRLYLPLMPIAIEQFDLSSYDLVISSSFAVAKGILTGPDQVHVAYVHSPMRYAWDMQHSYLRESGYARGLKSMLARVVLHHMRMWDMRTAHGPDEIIANSNFVARRIHKIYGRTARVIYPPVTQSRLRDSPDRQSRLRTLVPPGNYFLAASRLVPYKNIAAIVKAFGLLPDLRLIVAGDGPQAGPLRRLAGPNISFVGHVPDEELRLLMARARAFIFAAEEDFGISPVEAMSEGTPVIALGRGGVKESVTTLRPTGMFFLNPAPNEIAACVRAFEDEDSFLADNCRAQASRFSPERFREEFKAVVDHAMEKGQPELEPAVAKMPPTQGGARRPL
jgi:glycosyltransferase involved in cell wall biosynthesis